MKNIKMLTIIFSAIIMAVLVLSGGSVLLSQVPDVVDETIVEQPRVIKSLSLTNADIRSVMMYLSAYSDINIVVAPQVDAEITMVLSSVTWRQALDIILETYGLVGVEENNYIRVVKAEDYYAEKRALEQYNAEQATLKNLRTRIAGVKYNVASEISKAVAGLLSPRGSVAVDERTNSLILRDLPGNLDRIEELITILDKETRQIKISAQLLEIESRTLREIGVDWQLLSGTGTSWFDPLGDPEATPQVTDYWPDGNYQQNSSSQMASDAIGDFYMSRDLEGDYFLNAALKIAESSNKVKVIAHPEVTTVDNVEAFIQMGQKIPIKQFDPSGNTVITFYDVGIQLRVTPHVTSENRILMNLKPERSSYQFDPNGVIINTQNAETNVVVDNGQTTVIAGLTKQEEITLRVGIPVLKDIPLLGYLFSYDKKQVQNNDLVIFVTPTIIQEEIAGF
ncbi:MAG: type IV pilus secretin PilQ [candidate division Zixibacteria bacterium]|nr:type IV pilus secretin PilQ [candidate division Zixibacteria bacterium]